MAVVIRRKFIRNQVKFTGELYLTLILTYLLQYWQTLPKNLELVERNECYWCSIALSWHTRAKSSYSRRDSFVALTVTFS